MTIVVANSERMVDFFCENSFQQKNTNKQKIARALRTNKSSLSESYHASPRNPPSLAGQLQSHKDCKHHTSGMLQGTPCNTRGSVH